MTQKKDTEVEIQFPQSTKVDIWLLMPALLLLGMGIVMTYSASLGFVTKKHLPVNYFLFKELIWAFLGGIGLWISMQIDYRFWRKIIYPFMGFVLILLVAVLFTSKINGATRWLEIGGINFQPTEFTKLALILFLSDWLSRKGKNIKSFSKGFLPVILVSGILVGLILLQKDLGDAILVGMLAGVLLFVSGTRIYYLLVMLLLAAPSIYYTIVRSGRDNFRLQRFKKFLNPILDRRYMQQGDYSLCAMSLGDWFGKGLGASAGKLVISEAYTDYILAILGEELGFIGICLCVFAYVIIMLRGLWIAYRATDAFGTYVSIGIVTMMIGQAIVNMAVVLGLLPAKGLPLPFVSYGGSSLIVTMISVGILLNISKREKESSIGFVQTLAPMWGQFSRLRNKILPNRGQKVTVV